MAWTVSGGASTARATRGPGRWTAARTPRNPPTPAGNKVARRAAVIQSTPQGQARAINAQDGLFTLVERGLEHGAPVERTRLVGAISRALVADAEWHAVRDLVARPELQVIVSNVTEAGFRLDASFPARLTDLLHTRFAS